MNEQDIKNFLKEVDQGQRCNEGIPYFHHFKSAVEYNSIYLVKELINRVESSFINLTNKRCFMKKHGDNGYNIFHYNAEEGNIEILNCLFNIDKELSKELINEKNDEDMSTREIAYFNHYDDFCHQLDNLMGVNSD